MRGMIDTGLREQNEKIVAELNALGAAWTAFSATIPSPREMDATPMKTRMRKSSRPRLNRTKG